MPYLFDHRPVPQWTDLRDDAGHLYARVERCEWLLEVRRDGRVTVFRLNDYLRQQEPEHKVLQMR